MSYLLVIIICLLSFLLGSIPTAYVLVRIVTGKDLREVGSGNIGATNAKRAANNAVQGNILFVATTTCDILKGIIPVFIARLLTKHIDSQFVIDTICTASALLAILGHDTMFFLKNRKGKGVSITLGAFFVLAPIPVLIAGASFFILRPFTKVVSRRSLVIGVSIVLGCVIMRASLPITTGSIISAGLIVFSHKDNIKRIIKGEE